MQDVITKTRLLEQFRALLSNIFHCNAGRKCGNSCFHKLLDTSGKPYYNNSMTEKQNAVLHINMFPKRLHERLREEAFRQHKSLAQIVRESVELYCELALRERAAENSPQEN